MSAEGGDRTNESPNAGVSVYQLEKNMTVYVLIREDQNEYGYIDQSISGVFYDSRMAREREAVECRKAREEGLIIDDADSPDGEWQVSWTIEEHAVG